MNNIALSDDYERDGFFLDPELVVTKAELDACIAKIPEHYLGDNSYFIFYAFAPYFTHRMSGGYDSCCSFFHIKDG